MLFYGFDPSTCEDGWYVSSCLCSLGHGSACSYRNLPQARYRAGTRLNGGVAVCLSSGIHVQATSTSVWTRMRTTKNHLAGVDESGQALVVAMGETHMVVCRQLSAQSCVQHGYQMADLPSS
jgi:hypothetical protein